MYLRFMLFSRVYALLRGEKLSQKLYPWRKNDKYEVCDLPLWIFTVLKHLVCTLSSVQNDVQHMV